MWPISALEHMSPWLAGAIFSIVGSAMGVLGLVMQKKAQHLCADDRSRRRKEKKGKRQPGEEEGLSISRDVMSKPVWWLGVLLFAAHFFVTMLALTYAPETTVVPLGATQVFLNLILAYAFLHEVFNRRDMWATAMCLLGMVIAAVNMPQNQPGFMVNFPTGEFLRFVNSFFASSHRDENEGFAIYLLVWAGLVFVCVYLLGTVQLSKVPFALPMLVGLLSAAFHFTAKLAGTLFARTIWTSATYWVILATALLYAITVMVSCLAVLYLDCRFFVPTSFAVQSVAVIVQAVFFFREWQLMTYWNLVIFEIGCGLCVVGSIFVSPKPARVKMGPPSSPLLPPKDYEEYHRKMAVLAIMEEHRMFPAEKGEVASAPLEVIELTTPETCVWSTLRTIWRLVPLASCSGVLFICWALLENNYTFQCFFVLTLWAMHNGWKFGVHMALFSYVGQRKMAQYNEVDFVDLHEMHRCDRARCPEWKDIRHFVVLPNYKEEAEVLRLAIGSIAQSRIAKEQICLVLAMEEREEGSEDKANKLKQEFSSMFWDIVVTVHPPDLPGETAGKSSNCKWATDQVLHQEIAKRQLNPENVVFTVGDADSDFHSQYFCCLTFNFVRAGSSSGGTPDRFLSIWQAPILHYKNYMKQPHVVRLATMFTSQHELANLADPNACRVPYSTYSISAVLAKAVRGWDPDWISEDWHMGMKCFLATAGRLRIQPIFLGIMNYTPEGSSIEQTLAARWTQGRRHALGFSELFFFLDHLPRVSAAIKGTRAKAVFWWRAFFLWTRCLFIHLVLAAMIPTQCLTAYLAWGFIRHNHMEDLNSWTFLTYIVFQFTGLLATTVFIFTNVLLFEEVMTRIDGAEDPQKLPFVYRHRGLHFLYSAAASAMVMPLLFAAGGLAEWIAAAKTARTHKFKYDVAPKPVLGGSRENGSSSNQA